MEGHWRTWEKENLAELQNKRQNVKQSVIKKKKKKRKQPLMSYAEDV